MIAVAQDNPTQRRSVAFTATIVLHALLILFFILYKIITPIPPFPDKEGGGSGFELALGFSELGMGDNSQNPDPSTPAAQKETPPPPQADNALLTNEADDSNLTSKPADKDKQKHDNPKTEKPKQTQAEKDAALKNKLNNLWDNKGSGNTGHGASDTPGNAGGQNGSPNGNGIGNGTGSYKGDGWSVDLAGRTIHRKPVINDKPSVGGKVVMDIWVAADDGRVVRVSQNTSKSTTLDQSLVAIARRAALESTFYPDPKGAGEQKGTMTFVFELQ